MVTGLRVQFGATVALDGLGLTVRPGQLVGFLGPNGAGKTTTMRSILGVLTPQAGTITWAGAPIGEDARRRIGYMPEERGMYPRMPAVDLVEYVGRLAGLDRRAARASATHWLERLGLGDRLDAAVQELSHGNQQRVQLALALVHEPDLLVLDEPFSGLDPVAVGTMIEVIGEQAARGAAVLFSSHQLDLVETLCRQVVIIDAGRVVVAGEVDALRVASDLRELRVGYAGGREVRRVVAAGSDLDALLREARAEGDIVSFSFQPPRLSALFLDAVRT